MTPAQVLAAAVLKQAASDLFLKTRHGDEGHDGNPTVEDKRDALRFFLDTEGPFYESRAMWAAFVGKDEGALRRTVLELLNGDNGLIGHVIADFRDPKRARILADSIAETRRMWREQDEQARLAHERWLDAARKRKQARQANRRAQAEDDTWLDRVIGERVERSQRKSWGGKDRTVSTHGEVVDAIWAHIALPD